MATDSIPSFQLLLTILSILAVVNIQNTPSSHTSISASTSSTSSSSSSSSGSGIIIGIGVTAESVVNENHDTDIQSHQLRCNEYGFTENLRCTTCDILHQHIEDIIQLHDECNECCKSSSSGSSSHRNAHTGVPALYESGTLRVCS
jgi:hypothetical protein